MRVVICTPFEMPPPQSKPLKYTRRAEPSGWLIVRNAKTNARVALPEYTQVELQREDAGRTYFKIIDGYISVGQEVWLSSKNAAIFLSSIGPSGAATISVEYEGEPTEERSSFKGVLRQQWAKLRFDGQLARVTLNSVWNKGYTPIPVGTHTILSPDNSHANIPTTGYVNAAPGMVGNDTWFPIGLNGSMQNSSRYVHVGHLSEGCITVYELEKWSALYTYLISHRVPGSAGKRIGQIIVSKPVPGRR
jgi:hypothetical protein